MPALDTFTLLLELLGMSLLENGGVTAALTVRQLYTRYRRARARLGNILDMQFLCVRAVSNLADILHRLEPGAVHHHAEVT